MRGQALALLLSAVLLSAVLPPAAAGQAPPEPGAVMRVPARLTLDEALRLAESRNPALAEARARTALAETEALGASKRPNPSLDLESRGYPLFESNRPGFWDNQELTIAVDQEFEPGDRRRWRTEAAQLGAQASAAGSLDALRRLRLDVQRAYAAVVLASADRDSAAATLDDVAKVLSINRARYDQGELSGVELRRLQVERHRFADDALVADLVLRNARSRLLALLDLLCRQPSLLSGVYVLEIELDGGTEWLLTTDLTYARRYLADVGGHEVAERHLPDVLLTQYGGIAVLATLG